MFNVGLAGDHLYGKWLFTWLSLLMESYFVLYFVYEMSWVSSGTEVSQFLGISLPIFQSCKSLNHITAVLAYGSQQCKVMSITSGKAALLFLVLAFF